jgi:hypothetical protein
LLLGGSDELLEYLVDASQIFVGKFVFLTVDENFSRGMS